MATAGFLGQIAGDLEADQKRKKDVAEDATFRGRERQADALQNAIQDMQAKLSAGLKEGDPGYIDPAQLKQGIAQAHQQLTGLYQPHEAPTLFERLRKKISGNQGAAANQQEIPGGIPGTPGYAGGAGIGQAGGPKFRPGMTVDDILQMAGPLPAQTKIANKYQEMAADLRAVKKADGTSPMFTEDQIQDFMKASIQKPTAQKPVFKLFKLPNGTSAYYDVGDPDSIPEGANAVAPGGAGSVPKLGSFGEFVKAAYGDEPTADQLLEARQKWAKAQAGSTVSERTILVPQPDGSLKAYLSESTSTKTFGKPPTVEGPAAKPAGTGTAAPAAAAPTGLKQKGNIDLNNRPVVKNPDGTVSTVKSISIGTDQGEVLIPTVINGKVVSKEEAIDHYKKTGEHLGIFDTPEHATEYAKQLHKQQEKQYAPKKTAGELKKTGDKIADGRIRPGQIVGGREPEEAKKARETLDILETDDRDTQMRLKKRSAIGDTGMVMSWVRSQVRGAGRMTNIEIEQALKSGSFGTRFSNAYNRAVSGKLDDKFVASMASDIHNSYIAAKQTASKYDQPGSKSAGAGEGGIPKPAGATGKAKSKRDNKLHWTDGKNDLGPAE